MHTRLTNISDVLSNLDKMRLLINWGKADELMQISGVSIGIPQVQNFFRPLLWIIKMDEL